VVWRFLTHYGMNKASEVLDEFATAVVAFDPQAASKAQISMMEEELNKLGDRLATAEAELRREHQETEQLQRSYEQYLQAAQILENKLSETDDAAARAEVEASLAKIIDKLEQLQPEIAREQEEDREVEAWRTELRQSFEALAKKIRTAHAELKSAHRQMDMARLQQQRAQEQERRSKETAGLTNSMNSLTVALDAMNQQTAKVRAETEATKLKASLYQADRIESDPNIAAALATAQGETSLARGSLSDRLSALRGGGDKPKLVPAA